MDGLEPKFWVRSLCFLCVFEAMAHMVANKGLKKGFLFVDSLMYQICHFCIVQFLSKLIEQF